jgi:hypothetical protein
MPARQGGARRSALLVTYLEQLKGAPRALIDAFSAHNRGGDDRATSPSSVFGNIHQHSGIGA